MTTPKRTHERSFKETVFYAATGYELPWLQEGYACDDHLELAQCLDSAVKKMTVRELVIIANALDGVASDGSAFKKEHAK